MRKVAGLDLSLTSTGVALVDVGDGSISVFRVKPPAKVGKGLGRLRWICSEVEALMGEVGLVVIEAPSYGSTTGSQHERGGLWWMVAERLSVAGREVRAMPPTSLKKFVSGRGNVGKDEMLSAVIRRWPDVPVSNNDIADALGLAAVGARLQGHPIEDLPKANLAALGAAKEITP